MNVLHLIDSRASARMRAQQELDERELAGLVTIRTAGFDGRPEELQGEPSADVAHVYGSAPPALLRRLRSSWIGLSEPRRSRLPWLRVRPPAVPPAELAAVGESIDDEWLTSGWVARGDGPRRIGSIRGTDRSAAREQTLARILRFRDDIEWEELDRLPSPTEMKSYDAWVDAGAGDDGGLLEALGLAMPVIASRNERSMQLSAGGRAAWLTPPRDPNELAHAILTSMFKPETIEERLEAARAQRQRFRSRERAARLLGLYRRAAR